MKKKTKKLSLQKISVIRLMPETNRQMQGGDTSATKPIVTCRFACVHYTWDCP